MNILNDKTNSQITHLLEVATYDENDTERNNCITRYKIFLNLTLCSTHKTQNKTLTAYTYTYFRLILGRAHQWIRFCSNNITTAPVISLFVVGIIDL